MSTIVLREDIFSTRVRYTQVLVFNPWIYVGTYVAEKDIFSDDIPFANGLGF